MDYVKDVSVFTFSRVKLTINERNDIKIKWGQNNDENNNKLVSVYLYFN